MATHMTTKIEFTIVLNKEKFNQLKAHNTEEAFFSTTVLRHLVNDLHMIKNMSGKSKEDEKNKYADYIKCLTSIQEQIPKNVQYEWLSQKDNISQIKVSSYFDFYENEISTKQKMIENELFDTPIRQLSFMAQDLERFKDFENQEAIGFVQVAYDHMANVLKEAKHTLVITEVVKNLKP